MKRINIIVILFVIMGALSPSFVLAKTDLMIHNDHNPIIIDGNDDFTFENGVTRGNGTENDPYIIENWLIEYNGSTSSGIYVNNTDVHFIIQDCLIKDFNDIDKSLHGVNFNNVHNGSVFNSEFFENQKGILLINSKNIDIDNCIFHGIQIEYAYGIQCYQSSNITVFDCLIFNHSAGIEISDGTSNVIIDSTECHDNDWGIDGYGGGLGGIHNISITNCLIHDNRNEGIFLMVESSFRMSGNIRICNSEIFNNGVTPPNIANGFEGIEIWNLFDNIIENCTIYNNGYGIGIYDSRGNIIRNCSIYDHAHNKTFLASGIWLSGPALLPGIESKADVIEYCDIYDNEFGVDINVDNVIVENNNVFNNSHIGIDFLFFCKSKMSDNNIYGNGWDSEFGGGLHAEMFSFIDARYNWWGSSDGPNIGLMIGRKNIRIISLRTVDFSDLIIVYRCIALAKPWLTEPVPDAGRQT